MSDNWKRQMWVFAEKHVPLVFSFLSECKLQTYDKTYKKVAESFAYPYRLALAHGSTKNPEDYVNDSAQNVKI